MRISARKLNRPNTGFQQGNFNSPPENIRFRRRSGSIIVGVFVFLVFAVLGFIVVSKIIRSNRDYKREVITDLQTLYSAQLSYFAKFNVYGNFEDLAKAGLIPASSRTFIGCKNCDENDLWVGKNRDFQFEIQRNETKTLFCMVAISASKSDRAFAVGQSGVFYEDSSDKINCAGNSQRVDMNPYFQKEP